MLLYVDEKGPITAKTHDGTSWSSVQVKIENAQKKRGLLNVFGAYDHTNDKIHVHCYRNKTGKQFVDFIKRIDRDIMIKIFKISLLYLIIFQLINQRWYKKRYPNVVLE